MGCESRDKLTSISVGVIWLSHQFHITAITAADAPFQNWTEQTGMNQEQIRTRTLG
jgi:hypothetical protein